MSPSDFVNAINQTKEDLMANDPLAEKDYAPFIVNKGLSYFPDTILYANEMNQRLQLDSKLQFHYLLDSIRPRKRFSKWHKNELNEELNIISEYFGYSHAKAKQIEHLISVDQLLVMKEKLQKGGIKKENKNGS